MMTTEERKILLQEISKYIKENCYYSDGTIKYYDLWLVGGVAEEFIDRKNAMRALINNEYGLLGNLLNKLAKTPDESISRFIERADSEILNEAIDRGGKAVLMRNNLYTDSYAMRLLLASDAKYIYDIPRVLLESKEFLFSVVDFCPEIAKKVSVFSSVLKDEKFILSLVKKNYMCLEYLPQNLCQDYRFCMEAVRQNGFSMMYFDVAIRENDEIVLAAVSNQGNALSLALPRQKKRRDIVNAAVRSSGLAIAYADSALKKDCELVSAAVATHGIALKYVDPVFQDCDEIVRIAVINDGYAIQFASERLRDSHKLALLAINSYPDAYNYLSLRLQNDREIKDLYCFKKKEENQWHPRNSAI